MASGRQDADAEGIRTNVTLCFSAPQGLLAAKAGATYISPFVGRIDDIGLDGMELVRQLVTIYNNYGYETEVPRREHSPPPPRRSALTGAHVATIPTKVFGQLLDHPLTDKGVEGFWLIGKSGR